MSSGPSARNDAELDKLLARSSPLTREYAQMVRAEPVPELDARILSAARTAAKAATTPSAGGPAGNPTSPATPAAAAAPARASSAPAGAAGSQAMPTPPRPAPARKPLPVVDDEDDDDGDNDSRRSARPRWLIPALLAAAAVLVVGIGVRFFINGGSGAGSGGMTEAGDGTTAAFVRRARERREAAKAARQSAGGGAATDDDQDAAVVELDAEKANGRPVLPPPPIFAPEAPQVEDLDAAIALIRKDLVVSSQMSAMRTEKLPAATADAGAGGVVIQPRERRLAKILELYDGGQHELAADSLEIFLRDFADDPISRRILAPKK